MPAPAKQFVVIGNYPPDGQESMIRFAAMLAAGLKHRGFAVHSVAPQPVMVRPGFPPGRGLRKWLAYVDKWTLFPLALRRMVRQKERQFGRNVYYHVCDQSNAPYLAQLPPERTAISCHDVLAIRGALGYPDSYCAASRTGVILQRWILKHLSRAPRIGFASALTLRHFCEVAGKTARQPGWAVLHNAFNAEFKRCEVVEAAHILNRRGIVLPQPFLLHVGSNLPRKNRRMLLQMITQCDAPWPGHLCFAGEPADSELTAEARKLHLSNRVYSVVRPDHETLCALYSLAHAFVFPSFSEGFGWPPIEAQACGVPVIASRLDPLPEVTGGAALLADPHDARAFATALHQLEDPAVRSSLVEQGMNNAKRFDLATMIDGYLALHGLNGSAADQPSEVSC